MRVIMATVLLVTIACGAAIAGELGPVGARVTIRGRLSDTPWQHMIGNVPGKQPAYLDLDDKHQTVIYWAKPLACRGMLELTGTVIEVRGPEKRPRPGHEVVERHLDVITARCVD